MLDFRKFITTHIFSKCVMFLYALWWIYLYLFFSTDKSNYPHSCGTANGSYIFLTLLLVLVLTVSLIIESIRNVSSKRNYYLILLLFVWIPVLIILFKFII